MPSVTPSALLQLHLSILIAGFTGIFARLITADAFVLIFYRALLSFLMLWAVLQAAGLLRRMPRPWRLRCLALGMLLGVHYACFYGSIKLSNVSVGVICLSLTALFSALLEPLLLHRRLIWREIALALITASGITLIFSLEPQHQCGIAAGVAAALTASLYTVLSKRAGSGHDPYTLLFWEFAGALLLAALACPLYLACLPPGNFLLSPSDLLWMLIFCSVCTVGLYLLYIRSVMRLSAFTVALSYNLEPVYAIALAMLIFREDRELHLGFAAGLMLVITAVALQTFFALTHRAA